MNSFTYVSGLRDVTLKTAKEKEIPLQKFTVAQGYYYTATDKNPKPGEFTQLVEGVLVNQGYLINFTLLTNDAASPTAKAMIAALGLSGRRASCASFFTELKGIKDAGGNPW